MKRILKMLVARVLSFEASILLRRQRPIIVAVTGSVGKTTTKDAIYAAVKNHVSARKSEKSYNSELGVPLTVLGLENAWSNPFLWLRNLVDGFFTAFFSKEYPKVLVLETGIDRPGDMRTLTSWLKPDIVVLTRLPAVPVHVEYFASPRAVIEEKMKLVSAMKADGVLIYNHDDTAIEAQLPEVLQRVIGFGRYLETDFTTREDRVVYNDDRPVGTEFTVLSKLESARVTIKGTVGQHYVYAAAAAMAVAKELDIQLASAASSLSDLLVAPGRMCLIPGIKSSMIIDDTYNASPIACEHAFQALSEIKYAKRKVVVLGDMLELGKFSADEHRRLGGLIPGIANVLFTVGVRARGFAEGALSAGLSEKNIFQYDDAFRAGRDLQAFLQPGDLVLVKASQGIRAERIVEEVMAEPDRAEVMLVRQDKTWKTIA